MRTVNDKVTCFKSSKLLKGTDIYLNDDVSNATADIRRQKIATLKQKRNEGYIAYFRGADVITRRRRDSGALQHSTAAECCNSTSQLCADRAAW